MFELLFFLSPFILESIFETSILKFKELLKYFFMVLLISSKSLLESKFSFCAVVVTGLQDEFQIS